MQKSPTPTPFPQQKHNPLTISPLPHQRYQKPLKAISKRERRQGESRAKVVGELAQPSMSRTMSVTSLNSKPLTTISPLYIIRNKNPKTLHFPQRSYPLTNYVNMQVFYQLFFHKRIFSYLPFWQGYAL